MKSYSKIFKSDDKLRQTIKHLVILYYCFHGPYAVPILGQFSRNTVQLKATWRKEEIKDKKITDATDCQPALLKSAKWCCLVFFKVLSTNLPIWHLSHAHSSRPHRKNPDNKEMQNSLWNEI